MVDCNCLWTGVPPELIDAVSGDPEADSCGDDHQSDPDVGEETDAQLDEETAEGDDNGSLQQSDKQTAFWLHTASHPLLWPYLGAVTRHRIAGDDDIAVDLVAPDVPAGLTAAGKQFQIWPV